jgi:hypothetical protein
LIASKKILLLLSGLCFLAPFFYTGYFMIKKEMLKTNVENRFKKEALQTLVLNNETIVWEKAGKEIRLKEGLFDISHMEVVNGKAIIQGWFDHPEDKLNKDFSENKTAPLFPFFLYTYFQNPNKIGIHKIMPSLVTHHTKYFRFIRHLYIDVPTPPPLI